MTFNLSSLFFTTLCSFDSSLFPLFSAIGTYVKWLCLVDISGKSIISVVLRFSNIGPSYQAIQITIKTQG